MPDLCGITQVKEVSFWNNFCLGSKRTCPGQVNHLIVVLEAGIKPTIVAISLDHTFLRCMRCKLNSIWVAGNRKLKSDLCADVQMHSTLIHWLLMGIIGCHYCWCTKTLVYFPLPLASNSEWDLVVSGAAVFAFKSHGNLRYVMKREMIKKLWLNNCNRHAAHNGLQRECNRIENEQNWLTAAHDAKMR